MEPGAPLAEGATPYGRAALVGELVRLTQAPEGTRNNQLNASAYSLGRLVGGGEIADHAAAQALRDVSLKIGLDAAETDKTIRSGLHSGRQKPRRAGP